jgi:hypothetical protein
MSELVSLKDICQRLGVNPRAARIKLRASGMSVEGFRWEFPKGDVKRVEAVIRGEGDAPKAAAAKAKSKKKAEAPESVA